MLPSVAELSEQEAIARHLAFPPDPDRVSGLVAVLRDARGATGRHIDALDPGPPERPASWLGALGYLIFLEHVGRCLRPKSALPMKVEPLVKALSFFTVLGEREAFALYALRCGFAHSYSLWNRPRRGTPERRALLTHHFKLLVEGGGPVVALGTQLWDGNPPSRGPLNWTTVDLWALGDLAEDVFARLPNLNAAGELMIAVPRGVEGLDDYSFGFVT